VVCGDSTKKDVLFDAMQGERAHLCLTDPPYGLGGTVSDKNNYDAYEDSKTNLKQIIRDGLPLYRASVETVVLTPGNQNHRLYPRPTWTMAWFTPAGVGRGPWGFCCWQPILCYGTDPKLAAGKGSYPDALVHTEAAEKNGHPCAKPIKFWAWLMERSTVDDGDTVLDPFLGSGTTIIAAEQLNRRCFGIEIDPGYCDVIVERWENLTGGKATR
jgi:site-specific DNA-methyltransferase (adenine-specific)